MDRKNVATLRTCCRETKSAKKAGFLPQKSPVLAAKNGENGAFLAHPEPEILLIEVAYFSAATEYTFSAHCNQASFQIYVSLGPSSKFRLIYSKYSGTDLFLNYFPESLTVNPKSTGVREVR